MRIELPDGSGSEWAELIDPAELRNRDRKAVHRAITVEMDDETGRRTLTAGMGDDITDAMLTRAVTKWSLPLPLPGDDPAVLDELTLAQADALAAAIEPHLKAVMNRDDPARKDTDPTGGSAS